MAGLRLSQLQHWAIGKLDVKGAFMYAPLPPHMHVLVRPPRSWVRLGFVQEGELWVLRKAVYGLRIAPRAWGDRTRRQAQEGDLERRRQDLHTTAVRSGLTGLAYCRTAGLAMCSSSCAGEHGATTYARLAHLLRG